MRIPYYRAKDKDSDQWVDGFYAEFPMFANQKCELIPAIVFSIIDPDIANLMGVFSDIKIGEEEGGVEKPISGKIRNTLNFCTIDITTLQQIGEIEIGEKMYDPTTYIKSPRSTIILQ